MTSELLRAHTGMGAYPSGTQGTSNWREYFGFKVNPYAGYAQKYTAGPGSGMAVNAVGPGDTGFGGGDLRRARKAGHSAHSIAKYLWGDDMVGNDGQFFTQGGTDIGQEAINDLRGQLQIEQALKNQYHADMKIRSDYDDKLTSQQGAIDSYKDQLKEQKTSIETLQADMKSAKDAQSRMQSQYYNSMSSPITGNNALQIASASSPSQTAGMISQGLSGLTTGGYTHRNRTLNI